MLRGTQFRNIQALQEGVRAALRKIQPQEFEAALMSMPIRWMKCVASRGEYFEGSCLEVNPEQFGIEIMFGEESDASEADQSEEEQDSDDQD